MNVAWLPTIDGSWRLVYNGMILAEVTPRGPSNGLVYHVSLLEWADFTDTQETLHGAFECAVKKLQFIRDTLIGADLG